MNQEGICSRGKDNKRIIIKQNKSVKSVKERAGTDALDVKQKRTLLPFQARGII